MLDIQFIRENQETLKQAIINKNVKLNLDDLLSVDDARKELQVKIDSLRSKRNEIAELLKDDKKRTPEAVNEAKVLKDEIAKLEDQLQPVMTRFQELMLLVPNIPSKDTPIGKDDSDNVEVKKFGEPKKFDFEPKDHITLGLDLDILDLDTGVAVSGFRGYYLKNEGAQMHFAVLQYAFNKLISKGFTPMTAPAIVKEAPLVNMGQLPLHRAETYELKTAEGEEPEFLAGTAEVALLNFFSNKVLDKSKLPIRVCGYSPSYRSEAGSYGKDTKGLYRVHEFMKVEQVIIGAADLEKSEALHQELLAVSEEILQDLKLPYHVIICCTGDMGLGKYKMYDIESWMPSRNKYGETHSNSLLTDWQARRANIKYKDGEKLIYAHTLNNTAIASPRILIALWENYQNADGTITVPEVLIPYMMGKTVIGKK